MVVMIFCNLFLKNLPKKKYEIAQNSSVAHRALANQWYTGGICGVKVFFKSAMPFTQNISQRGTLEQR